MTPHERAAEPAEIHVIWAGATAPQKDPAYRLGHRDPGPDRHRMLPFIGKSRCRGQHAHERLAAVFATREAQRPS